MGRSRYKFLENYPHFLTCTVVNWLPIFSQPRFVQIIFQSLDFLQTNQRLALHAYVIMENHLHIIASSNNLPKEIAAFKSFTARSIIDDLKGNQAEYLLKQLQFHKKFHKTAQDYQLWQEGSHPQALTNENMFLQKLEYIHNNPVRRGYVDEPAHWRYSSYRNYISQEGLLNIDILDI
ncbi:MULTISPECIES: REP-associated tyrosine transposase [Calothrix]|uniref:Transposase n=2 Tax=Calothrix TaxID=1186 RepID=A0ABR8AD97_9CYAN|nr:MULTISPECIES: transposase [Calothrix]MBD2197318.1 transposase [Calothrix parietina FACHB-288]MBD2228716.1 transposase [Calothrix anomala FACHB-343]